MAPTSTMPSTAQPHQGQGQGLNNGSNSNGPNGSNGNDSDRRWSAVEQKIKALFLRLALHSSSSHQYQAIPLDPALKDTAQLALASLQHKVEKQKLKVAIVALVKGGKSTINNTTLEGNFLHVSNVPATSGITYISHGSEAVLYNNNHVIIAQGEGNIFRKIEEVNAALRVHASQTNNNSSAGPLEGEELYLTAPIGALNGYAKTLTDRVQFIDTPGRDEAANDKVKELVDKLVSSADVLVFVFNYTMLKTQSENEMWTRLMMLRPELLNSDRIYYIVNKFDQKGQHGLTEDETITYVSDNIQKYVGYTPERNKVFVMSAKHAFDSRMMLARKVTPDSAYATALLNDYFPGQDAEFDQLNALNWQRMLQRSKFLDYENRVLKHLVEASFPLLIESQQADLSRYAKTMQKALQDTIGQLGKSIDNLKQDVAHLNLVQEDVEKFMQVQLVKFYTTVKDNIIAHLTRFFDETKKVIDSLRSSGTAEPQKFSTSGHSLDQAKALASSYALDQARRIIGVIVTNLRATLIHLESGLKLIIDSTDKAFTDLFNTQLVPLVADAAKKHGIEAALVLPPTPPGNVMDGVLEHIRTFTTTDYDSLEKSIVALVASGTETVQKLENSTTQVSVTVREPHISGGGGGWSIGPISFGGSKPSISYTTRQETRTVPTVVAKNVELSCFFVSGKACERTALDMVQQSLDVARNNSMSTIPQLLDTQIKGVWMDTVKAPISTIIASSQAVLQVKEQNAANELAVKNDAVGALTFFDGVIAELEAI